jgi:hypothetical protein
MQEWLQYRRGGGVGDRKAFKMDFLRQRGSLFFFGHPKSGKVERDPFKAATGISWAIWGLMAVVTVVALLRGWPVAATMVLLLVTLGVLVLTFVLEAASRIQGEDICIDARRGIVIFPKSMGEVHGAYPLAELTLRVSSERPEESSVAVTRDWWVIVEGVLERTDEGERTFEARLMGPGYRPQVADEVDELRKLGAWGWVHR